MNAARLAAAISSIKVVVATFLLAKTAGVHGMLALVAAIFVSYGLFFAIIHRVNVLFRWRILI